MTSQSSNIVVKPPTKLESVSTTASFSVFLAGSIEMGVAIDWQTAITSSAKLANKNICFFNPRRDSWDSSWKQEKVV